jgi:S-adenosylmethionine:tRNA ribosyltransferase-isomerase
MRVDLLDYELPPELIAQKPPEARDGGRLLVVDPDGESSVQLLDATVAELAEHLPKESLLVVNDTRVLPARLFAKKPETGGKVEIFLVRHEGPKPAPPEGEEPDESIFGEVWRALGKASKPLRFDRDLVVGDDLSIRILGRAEDDGLLRVLLLSTRPITEAIASYGHVPLPPYIKRPAEDDDSERYQTVFARHSGAVAAPTAGLHLSNALLGRLAIAGHSIASVTLHVGLGTFQPVQVEDLDEHKMHEEAYAIGRSAARAITEAKRAGRPVIAVGTTVVRALEAAGLHAIETGEKAPIVPCAGSTKLLLQPGSRLRVVDGLLTNFHLPRSTLLALVAATIGVDNLKRAYAHAIEQRYRFYSYGDAMLIRRVLQTAR